MTRPEDEWPLGLTRADVWRLAILGCLLFWAVVIGLIERATG